MVATTEPVAWRTRPTGRTTTGREQQASRREDDRRGHCCYGNFHGEEARNGDERDEGGSASVRRDAGASAGRETKYCHRRETRAIISTEDERSQSCVVAAYSMLQF